MAAVVEVTFDAQKHINVSKGSIVGEDGGIGYLVYPMPPGEESSPLFFCKYTHVWSRVPCFSVNKLM
jgi:hypothetical protein